MSYSNRYRPELEAAEVMALPEGCLIVFSRGLRHITNDRRDAVRSWLPLLPAPPVVMAPLEAEAAEVARTEESRTFW